MSAEKLQAVILAYDALESELMKLKAVTSDQKALIELGLYDVRQMRLNFQSELVLVERQKLEALRVE